MKISQHLRTHLRRKTRRIASALTHHLAALGREVTYYASGAFITDAARVPVRITPRRTAIRQRRNLDTTLN